MSEETAPFVATIKAGGPDGPWLVIRGDTADQLASRLHEMIESDLADLTVAATSTLRGVWNAVTILGGTVETPRRTQQTPPPPQPQPTPPPPPPTPQQAAPTAPQQERVDKWGNHYTWGVPGAPACPHGTRVRKAGTRKDGTPFTAWLCPQLDRFFRPTTQCETIFQ
ncbi:MAG: hypothetical protein IRZ06_12655 [Nevskia sp.]|nr:hypothetical protein [Nevskia sp.]